MKTIKHGSQMPAFRAAEVAQIFEWIKLGESGSVIGVSNVGKSALFHHLFDPQVQNAHLGEEVHPFFLVRVNLNNLPDFKSRSVYSLILDALEMSGTKGSRMALPVEKGGKTVSDYHDLLLACDGDDLRIQRYFKLAVAACLQTPETRLVFLFDQFDRLYNEGQDALFYHLRGLHDGYQNRVNYILFTRQPLPDLLALNPNRSRHAHVDEESAHLAGNPQRGNLAREELYELLQANSLYLRPYNEADSERLLRAVASQNRQPFDSTLSLRLYALARGHAGLLRNAYLYALRNGPEIFLQEDNLEEIMSVDILAEECVKIWHGLTEEEQTTLAVQVREISNPIHRPDPHTEKRLEAKGLLLRGVEGSRKPWTVFSPLFAHFVRAQKISLDRPIFVDWKSRAIYVNGKVSESLSKAEFIVFKTLYERENTVVPLEELYQLCYPDESFDKVASPGALTAMIHRIRQKLHISEQDGLIQSKHKQGYLLRNRHKEMED